MPRQNIITLTILILILFFMSHNRLLGLDIDYSKYIESNKKITKLWLHGTPKESFVCPIGSESAVFKTDDPNKYFFINACNIFSYQIFFGEKYITYEEVDRMYQVEEAKLRRQKHEKWLKEHNNLINRTENTSALN